VEVCVRKNSGIDLACEAMRLSFNSESNGKELVVSHGEFLPKDDVELMKKLILSGDSHSKSMRMATVWLDLTMPRYWYSEWDTYKIGTTTMSESSVHKMLSRIKKNELTMDDFEVDKNDYSYYNIENTLSDMVDGVQKYNISVEQVKQMLPESFLQRRIVCTNYQTLRHIYFDRRNHRLPIWHKFMDELLKQLPFPEFITIEKGV